MIRRRIGTMAGVLLAAVALAVSRASSGVSESAPEGAGPDNASEPTITPSPGRGRRPLLKPTPTPTPTPRPAARRAPTATRTKVIGAVEITATAPPGVVRTPSNPAGGCLDRADGKALVGQPCVTGSYELHHDVTETPNTHQTEHVVAPLSVRFSLWAVAKGQLQGTAHLTYSIRGTLVDTQAKGCKVQTEVVAPFEWDVQLAGKYFSQPDGSTRVFAQATPALGPSFKEKFEDCPIPDRVAHGVTWSVVSCPLKNGVCDIRQDMPLPAKSTGETYALIHMEVQAR